MFDKWWKGFIFFSGVIVVVLFVGFNNSIKEVGSWADWFGAIGTILAVMVSVWITRYQIVTDKKATKENFFDEQEFIMLNAVTDDIINIRTSIEKILKDSDVQLRLESDDYSSNMIDYYDRLNNSIKIIEQSRLQINNRLYEYGRIREGYTAINMIELKALIVASVNIEAIRENIIKNNSIDINNLRELVYDLLDKSYFIEEAIIKKKKKLQL